MLGTKLNGQAFFIWLLGVGRVAFLIWFTAWVLTHFQILEKIATWFQ